MSVEFALFDLINGLAGRWGWLDALARAAAVYLPLAALLAALGVLWLARVDRAARRRMLAGLLIAAGLLLAAFAVETLLAHVLHHPPRARPMNARWTNLLLAVPTAHSFPAWPVALVAALAPPLRRVHRAWAPIVFAAALLVALALVFCGVNYPLDVLTGLFLGLVLGAWGEGLALPAPRPWRRLAGLAVLLALWGGLLAVSIKPASEEGDTSIPGGIQHAYEIIMLNNAPTGPGVALTRAIAPHTGEIGLAGNGRLVALAVRITWQGEVATKAGVEAVTRKAVNALYATGKEIGIITVVVTAPPGSSPTGPVGTLYTATIPRTAWPAGGFTPSEPLPGQKYFHPAFYARP